MTYLDFEIVITRQSLHVEQPDSGIKPDCRKCTFSPPLPHPHISTEVHKVAVCGGSGSFLLTDAIRAAADFFVTADFKYHEYFDAEGKLVIADIGHYESEQFTIDLICEIIRENFPTFAPNSAETNTNPVNYYT